LRRKIQPKFQEIWSILGVLEIFVQKTGFFSLCVAPLAWRLGLGDPNHKWFAFLDLE